MSAAEPDLLVVGRRVALGPLRLELAETYARWINQAEVKAGTSMLAIATTETEREWVERNVKEGSERPPKVAAFTVYDRSDLTPVGTTVLISLDHRNRSGELGIALGERRGQGLGTEATRLTLDWGFTILSLNNVVLRCFDWNAQATASYERAGFRHIGRRREAALFRGVLHDEVLMDAIASEFGESVLRTGAG